ncbi:exodeoxyribonuclease III [Rhizobacter sp. Root1221]|uniref:exodeoxyribonuclease III n=1 Tax=Rhizobacter sp. Root1221 TaxID=1736433 RepID=UPI0006F30562|nr:exodeoxyribonuclease III [Rhizobacter sp. Root1221]KQV83910.1 exodeoxyribonuclease III [Rhizobacter sp. Root1221]
MKIATWNVNGVNARLPLLLRWLSEAEPDVVCLQELKAPDGKFPVDAVNDAGYGVLWRGQASWNGVAILARGAEPIEIRRELPGDPLDTDARYLEAAVEGMIVVSLYLPNGNPQPGPKFDRKNAWFDRMARHAQSLFETGLPVVLAGDWNVVPTDAVADIYSTRSWKDDALLQPEPRAAWQSLLAQGWLDAIRHLHPDAPLYTFWDYLRQRWPRDAGLRIDHVLLSASLADALTGAGVDKAVRGWEHASDHAPVWVTLG